MNRDWKISIIGAAAFHVVALWGFQIALSQPPKLLRDTAVEVTLVAAPAPVAPAPQPAPPVKTPPEPKPPEITPPEPLPVAEPEPVVEQPKPIAQPVVQPTPPTPAPPAPAVGDNSSPAPGLDRTTTQAQPGEPARAKYRRNPKPRYPPPCQTSRTRRTRPVDRARDRRRSRRQRQP
ncbi:MAG: hypothetical protein WDM76_03420 [Limisphaerales bacterium]